MLDSKEKANPAAPSFHLDPILIGCTLVFVGWFAWAVGQTFGTAKISQPTSTTSTPVKEDEKESAKVRIHQAMGTNLRDESQGTQIVVSPKPLSPESLFLRTSPSVVQVVIQDPYGRNIGQGSGFVIGSNGLVVTNYHVIKGAETAQVIFSNGKKSLVIGPYALSVEADLALLKISDTNGAEPLELGGIELPPVGVKVYAIGNPLGLTNNLSEGLVSGHQANNSVQEILTTAPISPGSSGGPLLGQDGKVVGVTTAIFKNGQNLNIAVPASQVAKLLLEGSERKVLPFPPGNPVPEYRPAPIQQQPKAAPVVSDWYGRPISDGPFELDQSERAKCKIMGDGKNHRVTIYNGNSHLTITSLVLVLRTAKWTRDYAVTVNVSPLTSQSIPVNIGDPGLYIQEGNTRSIRGIVAAP